MVTTPEPSKTGREPLEQDSEGYAKGLGNRQVQMIAMGGAIGVGLFLGTGGRMQQAGPALLVAYLLCGVVAFFVLRALGELVLYRPVSGSFVEYAREFIGPWAGFSVGWMYWVNWAASGVAEITAAGVYIGKWFPDFPQWITALICLVLLLCVNLLSVKFFGELEFWFSLIKVIAIVSFLLVGAWLVITGAQVGGGQVGPHNLVDHGGFAPHGLPIVFMSLQIVIFAFASLEMVGIAAGETANPEKVLPKAINSVVYRILFFYVGSVLLLAMILPWSAYNGGESPFVTVFSSIGVPWAGDVMNFVVLTAALSSCNSGLYSTGRVVRSLGQRGEAPAFTKLMNSNQAPYGAVLFTGGVFLIGVGLNYVLPESAFDIATSIASLGIVATWVALLYCQLQLRKRAKLGEITRPSYRMPFSPYSNWIVMAFLVGVVAMAAFSDEIEIQASFWAVLPIVVVIAIGWRLVSRRKARGR